MKSIGNSTLVSTLSGNGESVRRRRANSAAEAIRTHQKGLINRIEVELARLEQERDAISDLSPDQTTSLRAVSRGFDPATFVARVHELDVEIVTQRFHLSVANKNLDEWFPQERPSADVFGEDRVDPL